VPLGPIEVVVIAFPGSQFTGAILPELRRLIDNDTISIVDGVLAHTDESGDVTFVEISEEGANEDAAALADLLDRVNGLISDEDVAELTRGLEPDSTAALLVFEHTWAKPLRDAIVDAGGILAANFRVPGLVVEEVLAAVAELD
jgi:hypothetical protein